MLNATQNTRSNHVSIVAPAYSAGAHKFSYRGLVYSISSQVFSPASHPTSVKFVDRLMEADLHLGGKRMMEIGCGTGFAGLSLMVLGDMAHLTAGDISPAAVSCATENSRRFGVLERAFIRQSNVFHGLSSQKCADIIYWNHPWIQSPLNRRMNRPDDFYYYDPGYLALQRFIQDVGPRATAQGRIFLGFGEAGQSSCLRRLATDNNMEAVIIASDTVREDGKDDNILLYELARKKVVVSLALAKFTPT